MTKKNMTNVLTNMFIEKFGGQEVKLKHYIHITLPKNTYAHIIKSVRQYNGKFEFFMEYGGGSRNEYWESDELIVRENLMRVLCNALEVGLKEVISYKMVNKKGE